MYIEYDSTDDALTVDVAHAIIEERMRQNAKWGEQNHAPDRWLRILLEELGEAAEALERADGEAITAQGAVEDYEREMIEVAAVAAAAVESSRRRKR